MRTWNVRSLIYAGLLLLLLYCFPLPVSPQNTEATSAAAAALAPYGACPAPSHEGASFCAPYPNSSIDSPFQVIASGTSGRGQVTLMELWADGKKVTQTDGTPFDEAVTLPPGTHELTVIEVDATGAFSKSTPLKLNVLGSDDQICSPPASAGVNVCEPMRNSCHTTAWVTVVAAGKGSSAPVKRMELWVNGGKIANFPGNTINTNLFIPDLSSVVIYEVDSKGNSINSTPITVQSC